MVERPDRNIEVENTEETLDFWLKYLDIERSTAESIRQAQVVLLPFKSHGDLDIPFFPESTEAFLEYLKRNLEPDKSVDICTTDADYKELALHHDVVTLPVLFLTIVVAPTVVNVVSRYISEKILRTKKLRMVKVSLTVQDHTGTFKQITYEGSGDEFEGIVSQKIDQMLQGSSDDDSAN
ncbi:MAG: hypothetical protein ABII79_09635 [bacterium]